MAAFVAPIISGLAGLFGGGQQQKTQTQSTQNQNTTQSQQGQNYQSGSVSPDLSPLQQLLAQMFTKGAGDLYNQSTNLQPYTTQGLQQIQGQGGANQQTIANILAARGLSASPAAATALTQNTLNSGNQANQFLQSIPLLQRQLQTQGLSGLLSAFGALPTGTTSTGSNISSNNAQSQGFSQGNSIGTVSGNPMGGLFGGLGAGLFAPSSGGSNLSSILNMFGLGGGGYGTNVGIPGLSGPPKQIV